MAATRFANEPCLGTRTVGPDGLPAGYVLLCARACCCSAAAQCRTGALRSYEWMSYGAAASERAAIGAGLSRHGVRPGDKVGLYSINCAEWLLTEAALTRQGCVSVPLYDTLGASERREADGGSWAARVSHATRSALTQTPPLPAVRRA